MSAKQTLDRSRKKPTQQRAKQTVQTILDATAQLLARVGFRGLTTNHLADRSGFSVGTIYQYFPNRESILVALIRRQREETQARIAAMLDERRHDSRQDRIRAVVGILHEAFARHRNPDARLLKGMVAVMLEEDPPGGPVHAARAIVDVWSEDVGSMRGRGFNEADIFVLSHALIEVFRQATIQGSPLLGTPAFEAAVCRMVFGFLRGDPPSA